MNGNIFLAILTIKKVITEDEAAHLSKQLDSGIIPTGFDFAKRHVDEIFKSYDRSQQKKKAIAKPKSV